MWKSRKELPPFLKLSYTFDIDRLVSEYEKFMKNRPWDAYYNEYADLRDGWPGIENSSEWKNDTSAQMALTVFNKNFEIRKNRNSGSKWDHTFYKNNKIYDGRAYNHLKNDLPPYFKEVIEFFQPYRERVILSKMGPNKSLKPHMDHDSLLSIRFHIALKTNKDCFLGFITKEGEKIKKHIPADGSVWFLNPGTIHWAENNSNEERIHLIINTDSQELIHESDNL